MEKKVYKVCFEGGDLNGAERFYSDFSVAKSVARRYVTRCRKKFGLCDDSYAEVRIAVSNRLILSF